MISLLDPHPGFFLYRNESCQIGKALFSIAQGAELVQWILPLLITHCLEFQPSSSNGTGETQAHQVMALGALE